jgi:hypothetical protein
MDIAACAKLRADAARCRRLSTAMSDKRTIEALELTAREFDAAADRLEAGDTPK